MSPTSVGGILESTPAIRCKAFRALPGTDITPASSVQSSASRALGGAARISSEWKHLLLGGQLVRTPSGDACYVQLLNRDLHLCADDPGGAHLEGCFALLGIARNSDIHLIAIYGP